MERKAQRLPDVVVRLAIVVVVVAALLGAAGAAKAQGEGSFVRIVHAAADVGPIDLFIDGRLAVVGAGFPSATDPLALAGGEHRITVAPSGASFDAALLDVTVAFEPGATEEVAIVGNAASVQAVLFPVDDAPLDAGRARFRVVHAALDAGSIDAVVAGGEAIFPSVGFLGATEYADVPSGSLAIDFIDADAAAVIATLPDLTLAAGDVADIYVVGQIADGSVQTLVVRTRVELAAVEGRSVVLREGGCGEPGAVVAELGVVGPPRGDEVGGAAGIVVENGFGSAPVSFDTATSSPHAVVVAAVDAENASVEACGAVAGALTDDGALAIPLAAPDGGVRGVAVVSSGVLDPTTIDVSVFLLPSASSGGGSATAVPEDPAAPAPSDGEEPVGGDGEGTPSAAG